MADLTPDIVTACVLLDSEGFRFHPGPPDGPEFEGLVRFCFVRLVRDGAGPTVIHKPTGTGAAIGDLFAAASERFHRRVEALDMLVREAEQDDFILVGPGVPPDFAEG